MSRPAPLPTAVLAGLVLLLAGCGGDDAEPPSAAELSRTIEEAGLSEEAADCATEVLLGSDLSDRGLRSLVEGDVEGRPDLFGGLRGDDIEALRAVEDDFGACAGAELLEQQQATSTTTPRTTAPGTTTG